MPSSDAITLSDIRAPSGNSPDLIRARMPSAIADLLGDP
jgi:hypothetical protein